MLEFGVSKAGTAGARPATGALLFLSRVLHAPLSVGSPLASSPKLVSRLLSPLPWSSFHTVIEFGAGTGSFTRDALRRLPRQGRLIAFDSDAALTASLDETINDPRLQAIACPAEQAGEMLARRGIAKVDCIITGIPFSTLPDEAAQAILSESARLLGPTGILAAYQVRSQLGRRLPGHFANVRHAYEWRHLPPCHLYWATGSLDCPAP